VEEEQKERRACTLRVTSSRRSRNTPSHKRKTRDINQGKTWSTLRSTTTLPCWRPWFFYSGPPAPRRASRPFTVRIFMSQMTRGVSARLRHAREKGLVCSSLPQSYRNLSSREPCFAVMRGWSRVVTMERKRTHLSPRSFLLARSELKFLAESSRVRSQFRRAPSSP